MRARALERFFSSFVLSGALGACAPPGPEVQAPRVEEPRVEPAPALRRAPSEGEVRRVYVAKQGVSLFIPAHYEEKITPEAASWSRFVERGGRSELWVRVWSARRNVTAEECRRASEPMLGALRDRYSDAVFKETLSTGEWSGAIELDYDTELGGRLVYHASTFARCLSLVQTSPAGVEAIPTLRLAQGVVFPSVELRRPEGRL